MNDRSRQLGFTLIELIVAMVILAILAAIAIPSYSNYVLTSHRSEAKGALLDLASSEERYFSANNQYTATPSNLGYSASAGQAFNIGTGGYYQVSATGIAVIAATAPTGTTAGTPASFTITASAIGNQTKDTACASFSVTSGGVQSATNSGGNPSTSCWQN
jgi:type IV pilus assembly protein PilE